MTDYRRHPFSVNVRDIVHRPGEMREHEYTLPAPGKLGEGLVAVADQTPIVEKVRFESVHEGILVTAELQTMASGQCSRCLTDITLPVEVEFLELFAYPGEDTSEYEVHDDHVDLEPLVRDTVVLALPFQPVCRPDCPGLDPETGERLAGHPENESRETLDPRWSALASFQTGSGAQNAEASESTDREER